MFTADDKAYSLAGAKLIVKGKAQVKGFTLDSRLVDDQTAFICFKGQHLDANDYVLKTIDKSCPLIVMSRMPNSDEIEKAKASSTALYYSDKPESFLQDLALRYRDSLNCIVIGITGSVGKTSIKELCKAVCGEAFKVHATQGNFNNNLGLPLTILSAPEDTQLLILEMGMSARHEIESLARIGKPSIAIISNVGQAHIGMLGSQDEIARAKAELLENLFEDDRLRQYGLSSKLAILNANNEFTHWMKHSLAPKHAIEVYTIAQYSEKTQSSISSEGLSESVLAKKIEASDVSSASLQARNIALNEYVQASFDVFKKDGSFIGHVSLQLAGLHMVGNALLALELALLLGIDASAAISALACVSSKSGRFNIIETSRGVKLIDDAYNASPNSVKASLQTMSSMKTDGRKFAVLGDMKELGAKERDYHYNLGLVLVENKIDVLVCVGELSKEIAKGAYDSGMNSASIVLTDTPAEALVYLQENLSAHDICLIKASHSCGLDMIVKGLA